MSGIDSHSDSTWTWLRPLAAVAGAIAAGAGAGVGTSYFNAPPPGSAAADHALARRVAELEAWQVGHDRDITRRWEEAGERMGANRGDIDRTRSELAELRGRVDRLVDRVRNGGGNGGGSALLVEPAGAPR